MAKKQPCAAKTVHAKLENELRYVLYRYEEHLAKIQTLNFSNEQWEKIWMVSPSDSIEHIWASSKAPNEHRHRLGNLVLLPPKLNSKLQAQDAASNVTAYHKTLARRDVIRELIRNASENTATQLGRHSTFRSRGRPRNANENSTNVTLLTTYCKDIKYRDEHGQIRFLIPC